MNKFGWSYPAGAENDPFAPYNQTDTESPTDASLLKQAWPETSGPWELYRQTYKYTGCGPSVGFEIEIEVEREDGFGPHIETARKWYYCDDLRELGTWDDCDGLVFTGVSVGSIVEGVDWDCQTLTDDLHGEPDEIAKRFTEMVSEVDQEAGEIWNDTHGCEDCPENPETGYHMIDPNCPTCKGEGAIL